MMPKPKSRYYTNDESTLLRVSDPQAELETSIARLLAYPQSHDSHGLFYGPTSVAYCLYRLSTFLPDLRIKGLTLLEHSRSILDSFQPEGAITDGSFGIGNDAMIVHLLQALLATSSSEAEGHIVSIVSHLASLHPRSPDNEWMSGRAGALYILRALEPALSTSLKEYADKLKENLVHDAMAQAGYWHYYGSLYYGAVHGDIGIIMEIALSEPGRISELIPHIERLLDAQLSDDESEGDGTAGNWPSRPRDDAELVQFCHGAPGFVISLEAILPLLSTPDHDTLRARIDTALKEGRECIWKRGILTKEPCLCHGITGNALALEPGERREHFLALTAWSRLGKDMEEGVYIPSSDSAGLYMGEAGRAWAWAVLMGRVKGVIGYNDV